MQNATRNLTNRQRRQGGREGAIIVLVAVILAALMVFVGFSVDLAHMQRVRTELRVATDLAAKAAAGALSATGDVGQAVLAGQEVAQNNDVAGASLTLAGADFEFGRSSEQVDGSWTYSAGAMPFNSVRVTGRRTSASTDGPVPLFFAGFFGGGAFETQTNATATFLDVDICLVLDRSSSMKLAVTDPNGLMSTSNSRFCEAPHADSRWVALANAVDLFLSDISTSASNEKVAVVTFASDYTSHCGEVNSESSTDQNMTFNLSSVSGAIATRNGTVWNGATNIDAGISRGRSVLTGASARPLAEKIMIVFTDGEFTGANPVPEAVAARGQGITVHTITFGANANETDMQNVAAAGRGRHFHAPDAATLNAIFRELAGTITILTK